MKCIQRNSKGSKIERVSNETAFDLVNLRNVASYVPKYKWKFQERKRGED